MPSREEIQRIAGAMNALRPDWRTNSLVTFLTDRCYARSYRALAVAGAAVASDPKCTTPNLLAQDGPWWAGAFTATGDKPPVVRPADIPRCTLDGHEHETLPCRLCAAEAIEGRPFVPTPMTPEEIEANRRGAERARAAIQRRGAGTGAGEAGDPDVSGATAGVTRSMDCPEAPAQARTTPGATS